MERRDPNEPTREPARDEMDANRRDEMDMNRRDEPAPTRDTPVNRSPAMPERDRTMETPDREEVWPSMSEFRRRFDELQVDFVEDPRGAVSKAEGVLKEAVDRMTSSLQSRLQTIHTDVGDGDSDTERLRLAMQRLRRLIDSFEERRAA